jgi:hypothetical protein
MRARAPHVRIFIKYRYGTILIRKIYEDIPELFRAG